MLADDLTKIYARAVQSGRTQDHDVLTYRNTHMTMLEAERRIENQRVIDAVAQGIRDARLATLQSVGLPADLFLQGVLAPIVAARLAVVFPELVPEDFIEQVKV